MLLFDRPPEPASFTVDVAQARTDTQGEIGANQKPAFAAAWSKYKADFSKAQHKKCGFCELFVIAGHYGDVEHYAPKGEVWELPVDPADWGQEKDELSNVEGRKKTVLHDRGYWWLAYEWSNYLLACAICNQAWKRSYFPVVENPHPTPDAATPFTPLLLNPFGNDPPGAHLQFDDLGQIERKGGSVRGKETIKTCGLDRESLRAAREEKARKAHHLAQRLAAAAAAETDTILKDFQELGRRRYAHAGMVRIVFEAASGLTWNDLLQALGAIDD